MNDAQTLLARCRELGAEFFPQPDGKLKVRAPAPLPDELRAELKQRKSEVLALLTQQHVQFPPWKAPDEIAAGYWTRQWDDVLTAWRRKDWGPCPTCGHAEWYQHAGFSLCGICSPRTRSGLGAAQQERVDAPSNCESKVVAAIGAHVFGVSDVSDISDVPDVYMETFTAQQIVEKVIAMAEEGEDLAWATSRKVGWIFSSLRLPKKIDTSTKKSTRLREVTKDMTLRLLVSHGILPLRMSETSER
jgi:hypothetical protein